MDFFFDNIFIIILLFVGAITQWLKARGEARQNQDTGYDPADLEEMMQEAERRHSRPAVPPPLPPAAFPQPHGSVVAPAPALRRKSRESTPASVTAFDTSAELARQQALADKIKEVKRARGAKALNDSVLIGNKSRSTATVAASTGLKARLMNRTELRQAFVLKELLDKPVGMR